MGFLKLILGGGFNPLYVAIAAAVIFAAGAASGGLAGWTVQGWKMGAQLERERGEVKRLDAQVAIFSAANEKCGIDVTAVKDAVKDVVDAGLAAADRARVAMDRAAKTSAGHLGRAENILNRPPVPLEQQCAVLMKEQREYVDERRLERVGR